MNKKHITALFVGLLLILIGLLYFSLASGLLKTPAQKGTELQKVDIHLKWLHQAQFAGLYVAREKGFYEEAGIDVNLEPFAFGDDTADLVTAGNSDFGVTGAAELIEARHQGLPVKAIAVIYKTTPYSLYSLKESGIVKPSDLLGKRVGMQKGTDGELLYSVMVKATGLDDSQIEMVDIGYTADELIAGQVDVSAGYSINEPYQAIEAGYDVNIIQLAEYGANMYGDVIFTTDEMINTQPELVKKFLKATLQGWQYAIENPSEAVDITLLYATDSTKAHQSYMLRQSIPLIHTGQLPLGWMEAEEWVHAQKLLFEEGRLQEQLPIEEFYTMQFFN